MSSEEKIELEFLRYFYGAAGYAFGPADSDIYDMIAESYQGELPEKYKPEEEDGE